MSGLFRIWLNVWSEATFILHNMEMEYLNNPRPELDRDIKVLKFRMKRLQVWGMKRWGNERIENQLMLMDYRRGMVERNN